MDVSVIVCTHNPRTEYLRRVLDALAAQTLPVDKWELLLVDNGSTTRVAAAIDLSWHARASHVREERIGLTPARLRGIAETRGELCVFVDDDSVLSPDYLATAWSLQARHPSLAVFGAGSLEPEFEIDPPPEIHPYLGMLALRSVAVARWSTDVHDDDSVPWGAGLCVRRSLADAYRGFVGNLQCAAVLDRRGRDLFAGGDDAFSWAAASLGHGFGVFPELRLTHLIGAGRLNRDYVVRLIRDHALSHGVLRFMIAGAQPRRLDALEMARVLLHGLRRGAFSMRCRWAAAIGETRAARIITERRLTPLDPAVNP